ncbi:hypothetical protein, partial [Acinetobacter terrae]|uniref:hypothetical protein n=1 Tax=Acinetobacter terrae TaxID=2731247 RepID=UPI000A97C4CA
AIKSAASSIAINKSLGLQADIQRLQAAATLMPELNSKVLNLNQRLSNLAGLTKQNLKQNDSNSVQNYLDNIKIFNEKYDQELIIDRTTVQVLDLIIHEQEALELASELKNIGIFDTTSGSILLEFSKTLPTEKAANFLNILLCLLMFFYEPVINEYEPIKNHREELANSLNGIEGKALTIKDCDLKYRPGGPKKMSLEKESLVIVYKNKEIADGWSKIKFNKDGEPVTGYIQTAELNLLD